MPSTPLIEHIKSRTPELDGKVSHYISPETINTQDDDGNTALHWAVLQKHTAIIFLLVQHKAKLNIENNQHETPAMLAKSDIKALTHALNGVNPATPHKVSSLCRVVMDITLSTEQKLASIKELLDLGHDINFMGTRGVPVLHCALHYQCSIEVISFLLENGANPAITTHRGLDALRVARTYKCSTEIIRLLMPRPATPDALPLSIPDRLTQTRAKKEQRLAQSHRILTTLEEAQQKIVSLEADIAKEQSLSDGIAQKQAALVSKMNPLKDEIASVERLKTGVLNTYAALEAIVAESNQFQGFLPENSPPLMIEEHITEDYIQENFTALNDKGIAAITAELDLLQQQYDACQAAIQQHQDNITHIKAAITQHTEDINILQQDHHDLERDLTTLTNEEINLMEQEAHMRASLREGIQRTHQALSAPITTSLYFPSGRLSPSVGDKRTASEISDPDDDIKRLKPTEGARPV